LALADGRKLLPDATDHAPVGLVLLWLLAALAGAIDARGIVLQRDIFLSFMSGNSTMLAVSLGRADWVEARLIGLVIGAFVAGAAFGQIIAELSGRWRLPVVVALVTALLALPPMLPQIAPLVPAWAEVWLSRAQAEALIMTFAMDALNAAMVHAGSVTVSITFVTGALVRFGQGLGGLLVGRTGGWVWLAQAVPWTGLTTGAVFATLSSLQPGSVIELALPIFAGVLTAVAATALWRAG
jgi:uncharacterized membrane protein YoaK (UPF0700 family)